MYSLLCFCIGEHFHMHASNDGAESIYSIDKLRDARISYLLNIAFFW